MQTTNDYTTLQDTLAVLRRRWLVIAVFTVVAPIITVGYAIVRARDVEPRYGATQTIAPDPNRGGGVNLSQAAILVNEGTVHNQAMEQDADLERVKVEAEPGSAEGTLDITAISFEPELSSRAVSLHSDILFSELAERDIESFERTIAIHQARIDTAQKELDALEFALGSDPDDERLQAEHASALSAYTSALDSKRAIETSFPPRPAFLVLRTSLPEEVPIGGYSGLPRYQHLALGLIIGFLLGLAAAYVREALDRRLTTAQTMSDAFGLPVLTEVPDGGKAFAESGQLAPIGSTITEAYRRLRTILQLERDATESAGAMVVLAVSAAPEEGKTTTVGHLARALGEVGHRVLAISADFRRPQLHQLFDVEPSIGLASLAGESPTRLPPDELVQRTEVRNVRLITAGHGSHDPTELLTKAKQVIEVARTHYDFIVVDSSPLLSANDALDLVKVVDRVIIVARFGSTNRVAAEKVRDMLMQTNAPTLGVVVSAVRDGEGYGYYYGGYAPAPSERDAFETSPPIG